MCDKIQIKQDVHPASNEHPHPSQTLQTLSKTRPLDIGKLIDTPPVGLPHQEGYIHRADRKADKVAVQRSQGQQQQERSSQEGHEDYSFGDHNGRLSPKFFAFDEMTHSAFVPHAPFAPPEDLLRNFGSRR